MTLGELVMEFKDLSLKDQYMWVKTLRSPYWELEKAIIKDNEKRVEWILQNHPHVLFSISLEENMDPTSSVCETAYVTYQGKNLVQMAEQHGCGTRIKNMLRDVDQRFAGYSDNELNGEEIDFERFLEQTGMNSFTFTSPVKAGCYRDKVGHGH